MARVAEPRAPVLYEIGKSATYTKKNAQFHWWVTEPGHWSLFDLNTDIKRANDRSNKQPDIASKLAAAYDTWWDDLFPPMIHTGGDSWEPESLGDRPKAKNE